MKIGIIEFDNVEDDLIDEIENTIEEYLQSDNDRDMVYFRGVVLGMLKAYEVMLGKSFKYNDIRDHIERSLNVPSEVIIGNLMN